jgi:predicted RNA binding protein YcfA (HicA-like mRNA interferase family)
LSGKQICRILSRHGFGEVRRKGSHIIMQKGNGGTTTVPVPDHKEVRRGTLQSIIRQSGVPRSEFESWFVNCRTKSPISSASAPNDLTQTALGLSRDDSAGFLGAYQENDIMERNPFEAIDQAGVGQLMEIGVQKGRSTKPDLKLGICGEHGGEPISVKFCHKLGLNYVSCSPFRIPIARLAAAQAALEG